MLQLFRFKGGVKPPACKSESSARPIAIAPLPATVAVPLHQNIGGTPQPIVAAGDRVLKGQKIGAVDGWISAAVHAPTSGIVRAVDMVVQPHPSGLAALSVIIEPDGEERWIERVPLPIERLSPDEIRRALCEAGVVGLGGAVFPSHAKLSPAKSVPMEELVINGAECEPYITCDDRLMRERAEDIVRGTALFRDLMQPKRVLIGIEDNTPEAAEAMRAAVSRLGEDFATVVVPTLYPAGGAKQLIRVLTGKEVPNARRSTDMGVQCFNVATAYTAWRAVAYGEPVISRLATVAGNVDAPGNWEVLIGTPLKDVIALGQPRRDTDGVIMGGPMMGFLLPSLAAPLTKATNCLIASSPTLFPPKPPEMPCIRCGDCALVCPHELQPFEMYWWARAKNFGKAQEYALFDCIECGCCAYVCPSKIPLVQYFRFAKSEIWSRERNKKAADAARERFELRNQREAREKQEKAEKLAKAAATQKAKAEAEARAAAEAVAAAAPGTADATQAPAGGEKKPLAEADKKALIVAAMARAQAQRAAAEAQRAAAEGASATKRKDETATK